MTTTGTPAVTTRLLHEISRGYLKTALLRTAMELRLFDGVGEHGAEAGALADERSVDPRALRIVLDALVSIGLLRKEAGRYTLPPGGREYLLSSGAQYFGGAVRLGASDWEWEAQRRLTDAVRKGGTVLTEHYLTPELDYWEDFAEHTTWFNNGAAEVLADQLVPWARGRASVDVLDVAASHGAYGFTFARREPRARIWCLDWPNVLPHTRRNAERLGLADRLYLLPGDMFEVPLGGPYDVLLVTNVLHHFAEDTAVRLLTRLSDAVKPGGRIAVVGHTYREGDDPARNPMPFLFSVSMLAQTHDGETHSVEAYERMLSASGFTGTRMYTGPKAQHTVFLAEKA
ncbi:methyltransferase [Streptomyces olivaceoviridis]